MSTNIIRPSRKRKIEKISLVSSNANSFHHRPLQNVFSRDSPHPAPSRHPQISTSTKVPPVDKSLRRRLHKHASKKQSTGSRRANADSIRLAAVGNNFSRKKGIKKSISELPKLFTRFLKLDSKSDNKSADSADSKCSAGNMTTDRPKSKSHRWAKFMMRFAANRILPISPRSQPSSSISNTESSLRSNLKPNTNLKSSSKSDPFGDTPPISAPVLQPVRVNPASWRQIQRKYTKRIMKSRFPEPLEINYRNGGRVGQNPAESAVPRLNLPASFTALNSESYPFGDVPFIASPVLKPVRLEITPSAPSLAQPTSTQIPKPAQNEVSSPIVPTRRRQQICRRKAAILGSSCGCRDPNRNVKFCLEFARLRLSHLQVAHSGISADSLYPDQFISPSNLDSNVVGQVTTSKSARSLLHNKRPQIPASCSTIALTSDLSSPRSFTLCSSTSSSDSVQEIEHKESAYLVTNKSNFVAKPGCSGRVTKTSAESQVSQSYSEKRKEFIRFGAANSSFSSSSTNFQNSTETIDSTSGHKNASMTNLLLADSTSSASAGSNAETFTNLRGTNTDGQFEFIASSSPAANKLNVSHIPNTSRDSSGGVQSMKVKRRKPQNKRKFFRKLKSAFSTTAEESKSKLLVSGRKNLVRGLKKKPKENLLAI